VTTLKGSHWVTVITNGGYLSSSDPRAHFGLRPATTAQSVEISWPSGTVQVLANVAADHILQVDEPKADAEDRVKQ
jgi:enediyne biosynthesis protein E4